MKLYSLFDLSSMLHYIFRGEVYAVQNDYGLINTISLMFSAEYPACALVLRNNKSYTFMILCCIVAVNCKVPSNFATLLHHSKYHFSPSERV